MIAALLFYYFKQRKRGHEEAALAAKNQERDRVELEQFKKEGRDPDALAYEGADYDASSMRKNGLVSTASYSVPSDDYDRSNSLHNTQNTPAWDPTTSGMISPGAGRPLLQDNGSGFNGPSRSQSFGPAAGQSPGYTSPAVRNMSTPNPSMRMGSPGPQGGGYGNIDRVGSPASFRQPQNRGYGNGDDGYFGSGNGYR